MTKLIKTSIYKDGGTTVLIEESVKNGLKTIEEAQNCQKYYLDYRIGTKTKGELYDKYPGDKDAKIVNKEDFEIIEK